MDYILIRGRKKCESVRKAFAMKPEDLSLVLRTHRDEGENRLLQGNGVFSTNERYCESVTTILRGSAHGGVLLSESLKAVPPTLHVLGVQ